MDECIAIPPQFHLSWRPVYGAWEFSVKALVPEGALSEISLQDTVYISSQYQETPGELIPGVVEKISSIPEKTDSTEISSESYYAVFIAVPDASTLRYGMNVTVTNAASASVQHSQDRR